MPDNPPSWSSLLVSSAFGEIHPHRSILKKRCYNIRLGGKK